MVVPLLFQILRPRCGLRMTVLLGLDSTDVGLAVLKERITVDVGSDLLKEGLDVS